MWVRGVKNEWDGMKKGEEEIGARGMLYRYTRRRGNIILV